MARVAVWIDDGGMERRALALPGAAASPVPTICSLAPALAPSLDADAERFVRAVMPRLVGALTIRLGDRAIAEDLAQEAFARAWADWPRVAAMENPVGWVYRVAFNLTASHWRRRAAQRRAERRVPAADPPDDDGQVRSADAMVLREAIGRLSDRQQQVVILRFYLGCSVEETAAVLGVTTGTVKTQSSRAMTHLRDLVGARGVDA